MRLLEERKGMSKKVTGRRTEGGGRAKTYMDVSAIVRRVTLHKFKNLNYKENSKGM